MSVDPLVSVVMPVYNGGAFLAEAVESILGQTFRGFEFVIVDDGSTDDTGEVLADYQRRDPRVRVFAQPNQGIAAALNTGCRLARGTYLARMDADDVSLPMRLEHQVAYLEAHPDVGVVGTWLENIDETGTPQGGWRTPTDPDVIRWGLLFGTCLAHVSTVMRREVVARAGFYRTDVLHAEDYDLWLRLERTTRMANLPEALVRRRQRTGSMCDRFGGTGGQQEENVVRLMHRAITDVLGADVSVGTVRSLRACCQGTPPARVEAIEAVARLVRTLYWRWVATQRPAGRAAAEIRRDAAGRLATLAALLVRCSLPRGCRWVAHAAAIDRSTAAARVWSGLRRVLGGVQSR